MNSSTADSSHFHGTHVSGSIAAVPNIGKGVAGEVAWNVKIMPVRVLGVGGGSLADIIDGYCMAGLDTTTQPQPAKRADIINLSAL